MARSSWRWRAVRRSLGFVGLLSVACARAVAPSATVSAPAAWTSPAPRLTSASGAVQEAYGRLPLYFEENRGQADPSVKYLSRGRGYALFLTSQEVILRLGDERVRMT